MIDSLSILFQFCSLGQPSLSSRTTVTLIIVPRNEFAPVCHINDDRSMWSIMENSAHGTTIGTILCSDEDQHEPNQLMTVQTYWFPDQNGTARTIPFDIKTIRNQTSKVKIIDDPIVSTNDHSFLFHLEPTARDDLCQWISRS